ncbi:MULTISPECIES: FAD-dependent oxidoreductase [Rhodomicrobium]|uniref:NAD(P)/FAD-dependent oxidoreductase n=1 Tax=Rhodomicrobium TaxID=1068 RepID=UPI000B4AB47E|nr:MULTISPECIES: FAD-dependent oxidoreductase [Rhodomicrobium]
MRLGKHIAVIGAGVVGLAIAVKLRREGYRVSLFDAEPPGSQTSSGNAALIMTAQIGPLSAPGLWRSVPGMLSDPNGPLVVDWKHLPRLMPWFVRFLRNSTWKRYEEIAETLAPLVTRSFDSWLTLVGPHEGARLFRRDGLLYVFKSQKTFRGAQKDANFRARYGVPSEVIPAEELRQMEPSLGGNLVGGLLYPDSGHCTDPVALSNTLASAFRTGGGEFKRSKVRQLAVGPNGTVRVVTDEGEVIVDEAVVAAGIWSPPLVKPFGVRALLAAERGYNMTLRDPQISLRLPICAGDDKFVITPLSNGIRLAGTAEFAGLNAPPNWRRSDILLEAAKTILPEIDGAETATRWMGARPSTPDSLPIIGRTPKNPNIICAFGHSHLGLTLGAVTAELVADLVGRRGPNTGIAALRPDRF